MSQSGERPIVRRSRSRAYALARAAAAGAHDDADRRGARDLGSAPPDDSSTLSGARGHRRLDRPPPGSGARRTSRSSSAASGFWKPHSGQWSCALRSLPSCLELFVVDPRSRLDREDLGEPAEIDVGRAGSRRRSTCLLEPLRRAPRAGCRSCRAAGAGGTRPPAPPRAALLISSRSSVSDSVCEIGKRFH